MENTVDNLILDLLEWLYPGPRSYADVLDAWRTSCPRLPIWEEANARGLLVRHFEPGVGPFVTLSARGREALEVSRMSSMSANAPSVA